jgi:CHAT domain-containing protein
MSGPGRLLVLAHGPLERMPFDLMPLAERGAVSVLPGLADSTPGAVLDPKALAEWSIFGDPASVDGSDLLPGARAEVESLALLVGGRAQTGDAFDREALLGALRSGRALHIATHLVTDCSGDQNKSGEAGLLLARDTFFCSREIREEAHGLPIAVLAACQTAEGSFNDSQALASVSNAFLGSGTRNLCVTLWPIEDGAARRWSEAFHKTLAKGSRPSEAALVARDTLRREGVPVSEWAAFRFAGRD